MPDPATVQILVDKFGWPGLTVAVCLAVLWRVMVKHEGQMQEITKAQSKHSEMQIVHLEINRQIAANIQEFAHRLREHDDDEDKRHEQTRREIRDHP
jgi:hypothetical protein